MGALFILPVFTILAFYILWVIIIIINFIWQIAQHFLYSFALKDITNDNKSMIPFYNKYLLGRITKNKIFGIMLAVISLLRFAVDFISLFLLFNSKLYVDIVSINGMGLAMLFVYIIDIILVSISVSTYYKKHCNFTIYTILSILSWLSFSYLAPFIFFFTSKYAKSQKKKV